MAYGGLRGAVGFSLVMMIDKAVVPSAGIFVTTTLAVVISTVFIQVCWAMFIDMTVVPSAMKFSTNFVWMRYMVEISSQPIVGFFG